jgi:Fe-S-cluster containining protein
MNPPFQRTVCGCAQCVQCCKEQPGHLIPSDITRIQEFLNRPVEGLLAASQGALVLDIQEGRQFRIRTVVPKTERGRCVFLTPDDKCGIHPVAPFGCSFFDTHMSVVEGQKRSSWGLRMIRDNVFYQEFRKKLPLATTYKPRKAL